MTKFKFNVTKTNEMCEEIKNLLAEYDEVSDNVYANVKSSKSVWTDAASEGFNDIVAKNETTLSDIKNSLTSFHDNITNFSQELGNIISSKGYSTANLEVDYDSSQMKAAINSSNDTSNNLQRVLNYFASASCPSDFSHLNVINNVYNAVARIKTDCSNITSDMKDVDNSIDNLVNNASSKNNSIDVIKENAEITKFTWSTISVSKKEDPELEKFSYRVANEKQDANIEGFGINHDIGNVSVATESEDTKTVLQEASERADIHTVSNSTDPTVTHEVGEKTKANKYNVSNDSKESVYTNQDLNEKEKMNTNYNKKEVTSEEQKLQEEEKISINGENKKVSVVEGKLDESDEKLGDIDSPKSIISENKNLEVAGKNTLNVSGKSTTIQGIELEASNTNNISFASKNAEVKMGDLEHAKDSETVINEIETNREN